MALGMMLFVATGMARYGGHQDPRLDLQFAIPASVLQVPVQDAPSAPPAPAVVGEDLTPYSVFLMQAPADAKKVSAHFSSATAKDVLDWLQSQGVSFIVDDSLIPSSTHVTLNIVEQPVDVVADALAQALGGHWLTRNGIRVFRKGPGSDVFALTNDDFAGSKQIFGSDALPKAFTWSEGPSPFNNQDFTKKIEEQAKAFQKEFGPSFQQDLKDKLQGQDWQKQFGPDFQQKIQGDLKGQFGPDWQQKIQGNFKDQFGPEFQQKIQGDLKGQFGPDWQQKIQGNFKDQFGPDFQMKLRKDMQSQFGPDFEKRIEKMAQDLAKNAEELAKEIQREQQSGQYKSRTGDPFRPYSPEIPRAMPKTVDAEKFFATLTPGQKDIAKTRGYLRFNDLTDDQRKMLGGTPIGHMVIKFKSGGQQIEIRDN